MLGIDFAFYVVSSYNIEGRRNEKKMSKSCKTISPAWKSSIIFVRNTDV
jgi:hypothetical protein